MSRDGAPTASLTHQFQCLTTPTVTNFFLVSHLNLLSASLEPFLLVLPIHAMLESPSPAFLQAPFRYWRDTIWPGSFQVLSSLAHKQGKNRLMPTISGQPVQRKISGKVDGYVFLAWLAGWVLTAQQCELLSWVRCVRAYTAPCTEDILQSMANARWKCQAK